MTAFVPGVIRFLGAFQAGVGFSLVPQPHVPAVGLGLVAAAATFALNKGLDELTTREVFVRGYATPLVAAACAFLFGAGPASWDAAGYWAERFVAEVLARTPPWSYFAALGFGAYREHTSGADSNSGPNIYR